MFIRFWYYDSESIKLVNGLKNMVWTWGRLINQNLDLIYQRCILMLPLFHMLLTQEWELLIHSIFLLDIRCQYSISYQAFIAIEYSKWKEGSELKQVELYSSFYGDIWKALQTSLNFSYSMVTILKNAFLAEFHSLGAINWWCLWSCHWRWKF